MSRSPLTIDPERRIAIGADHAGYRYKEAIKRHLLAQGWWVMDAGTHSTESTDYPTWVRPVAEAVARGDVERGIVLGGSGNGEAMVANRVTYRLPSAVQDLGRALGVPPELRDRLTRALGRDFRHLAPAQAARAAPAFNEVLGSAPVKGTLLELLALMEDGFVRHLAPHSGGVVLSAQRSAEAFYRGHGFEPVGEPYDEVGIAHVRMQRAP